MIFLDTSAIYALADTDDQMHEDALCMFRSAQENNEEFLTHSYVLVESAALLQRRLGIKVALAFLAEASVFNIVWVDQNLHNQAVDYLKQQGLANLSLVDALSILLMREKGIDRYLGFDKHFSDAGFTRYS